MGAGVAPVGGGVDADHVGAELLKDVDATLGGDLGDGVDGQAGPEAVVAGEADGVFFAVVDEDAGGVDAGVVFEDGADDLGAFVFVDEVGGVDEDGLVVLGGEVDVFFEDGDFVAGVFVEADFADAEDVGVGEEGGDEFEDFAGEVEVFGFLGVDAEPGEVLDAVLGGAFGFDVEEVAEVVVEAGGGGAVEAGPEGGLGNGYDAAAGHEEVVVGGSGDTVDVGVDEGHGGVVVSS